MDAFLIRLTDPEYQEYLQRNPFLNGPDHALNRRLREAWYSSLEVRRPGRVAFTHDALSAPLTKLVSEEDRAAVNQACARVGLGATEAARVIDVWAWKATRAPRNARRILSVGCGEGQELVVLRALFPDAELQGVDYNVVVPAEWRGTLRLGELKTQNIDDYLAAHPQSFDVVFSNHSLEHLSAPERTLRLVRDALVPGGTCVSAVPLEADPSNPFYEDLAAIALGHENADPYLDFELINPAHSWKTNRDDLAATFHNAGFRNIRMFTRANYPSYFQPPLHVSRGRRMRIVGKVLEHITLRALRRGLRGLFPGEMPHVAIKGYYTLAGRCWFSRLRLIHNLMHEVVVTATASEELA